MRVAIFERDNRTADELKAYIRHHYYADVECVDGAGGDIRCVREMQRFKPSIFIVARILSRDEQLMPLAEKAELQRHVDVALLALTFETRPYLASIGDDKLNPRLYRRFKGVCEEFGYDSVCLRKEVNAQTIAYWVNRARQYSR